MTTATCKHCRQEIEEGSTPGRPISVLSGDEGGTYDICPDAPPQYENDCEPPHAVATLYGKPRPKQPHLSKIFDAAYDTGRVEVTEVVERALAKIPAQTLMYPDFYAHEVTRALIKEGVITP